MNKIWGVCLRLSNGTSVYHFVPADTIDEAISKARKKFPEREVISAELKRNDSK